MTGYTKLFSSILMSSIWEESMETRLVWVTMLALADQHGHVDGTVKSLARVSRVTLEQCQSALDCLLGPDVDDRSGVLDGRRLVPEPGGWGIVNHTTYRNKMSADDRRERDRIRKRNARMSGPRPQVSKNVRDFQHTEAEAKADTKAKAEATTTALSSRPLISGEASPKGWGKIHGDHVAGFCDWVCLPEFLFNEFARKSAGPEYVRGWADAVRSKHQGQTVGDNLKFWRVRWSETHPEIAAKPKVEPINTAKLLEQEAQRKAARLAAGGSR